jgi:DNA-binding response OmpR family regulator
MSYRILLVETDRVPARAAEAALIDGGHRVAHVDSFADAVRLGESLPPDLLITTLRLGALNGLHLLLRLRANTPDMPAIIVGDPSDFTADVARFGGRFLEKPIDPALLRDLSSQLLQGRAPQDPTGVRTWPRKRAELRATVKNASVRVVELSYGGMRLELARVPVTSDHVLQIKLPTLGLAVAAVPRWQKATDAGVWWCGAEITHDSSDAARTWRDIVDSLNS